MFISNLLHCALNHSVQIAKLSRGSRHSFGVMLIRERFGTAIHCVECKKRSMASRRAQRAIERTIRFVPFGSTPAASCRLVNKVGMLEEETDRFERPPVTSRHG